MNRDLCLVIAIWASFVTCRAVAQNGLPAISHDELLRLHEQCAPEVSLSTLEAIVRTESGLHPYALSINYPHHLAKRYGFNFGTIALKKQPRSKEQAIAWTLYLLRHGITASIGLMQINVENLSLLHLSLEDLFDPCTNLRTGARVLADDYGRMVPIYGPGQKSLHAAFSLFNSGASDNLAYIRQVLQHAGATGRVGRPGPSTWK